MTDHSVRFNFSSVSALKVSFMLSGVLMVTFLVVIIITLRTLSFDSTPVDCLMLTTAWALAIAAAILMGCWINFARKLKCVKPLRGNWSALAFLALWLIFAAGIAIGCAPIKNTGSVIRVVLLTHLIFGGDSAFEILAPYLDYRREHPERDIKFSDYCNMTQVD